MPDSGMTGNLFFYAKPQTEKSAETDLVEQMRTGNEEAFNKFYKKYAPMVHGIVLARVRHDEVADIVQEVFLSAFRNLQSLRDNAAVGAWLAMIARNQAAQFYRTAKPTEELSEDLREKENPHTEASEILQAIRSLPDAYCETLILRLVEGMTGPEIAERTGLTHDSVRVNLHRGMKLLREKLGIKEQK